MKAYIKSFAAMRTQRAMDVIASAMCIEASSKEASTLTVTDTEVSRDNAGGWLVLNGGVWLIDQITPQEGRTLLQCLSPFDAFSRPLVYTEPAAGATIGGWIAQMLAEHWRDQTDGVYAMPYLDIENVDATAFIAPTVDENGLFNLTDYMRQVWQLYNVKTAFSLAGNLLHVRIAKVTRANRNVVFTDGHAQLESAAYSRSGVAKITAVQGGVATNWYLSDTGEISTSIPERRAQGTWEVLTLSDRDIPEEKVRAAFAKNAESHKIEFWSDRLYNAFDNLTIRLNGEVLRSYVSYVGTQSTDDRFFYKSGELATTAAEKLKKISENTAKGTQSKNTGSAEIYEGSYTVIPSVESQTLETASKTMADDLLVESIPFYEVSNTAGGVTVTIG